MALVAARPFMLLNGVNLEASQEENYPMLLHLAEGGLSEAELAEWTRARIKQ